MTQAAKKRSPATVALDLRLAGQVAAVAVDGRGTLAAWTVVSGTEEPTVLARRALRELRVRPQEVRVLLGAGDTQVAVLSQAPSPGGKPGEKEIAAALYAEGYERLSEPSVAALALAPGDWLVAACGSAAIEPLAAGLLEESGTEPAFVVDQLLAEEGLKAGPGRVELGEALPEACELAWQLAHRPAVTRLASPRGERRRASLAWARRATRAALVVAALGVLAMAGGMRLAWANRVLASQAASDARALKDLRENGALAAEAKRLQAELAGRAAPWPRLAETIAALARQLPAGTAWERFEVKDGALELEASAAGAAAGARLDLLRHTLERTPGLLNLSWRAPAVAPRAPRLHQVFRAAVTP